MTFRSTRLSAIVLSVAVLTVGLACPASARALYDKPDRTAGERTDRLTYYSFPQVRSQFVTWGEMPGRIEPAATDNLRSRLSLGATQASGEVQSPGFTVVFSYNDDQMVPGGNRQVDFHGPTPSMRSRTCIRS